jgi:glycine oxidase
MSSHALQPVHILGAGIAGLWQALLLRKAGFCVTVYEPALPSPNASWWAGGMLAPDCETESAEPVIAELGREGIHIWREHCPEQIFSNGSLVLVHNRDKGDFQRFAQMTQNHALLNADELSTLEPALENRFSQGLFFSQEAHIEPRRALEALRQQLQNLGVAFTHEPFSRTKGMTIDCRGLGAREANGNIPLVQNLRGVKGETVTLETKEIAFSRPIRLLHPRWPLYVVPRQNHQYLIGATMVESEETGISMRSTMELLNTAYALHPAFAEARIVELGCGLRPAFPDHKPRILIHGDILHVNGLFRHGYLIAPALAALVRDYLLGQVTSHTILHKETSL